MKAICSILENSIPESAQMFELNQVYSELTIRHFKL